MCLVCQRCGQVSVVVVLVQRLNAVSHLVTETHSESSTPLNSNGEPYYVDDPKKALRAFFDRETVALDYEVVL